LLLYKGKRAYSLKGWDDKKTKDCKMLSNERGRNPRAELSLKKLDNRPQMRAEGSAFKVKSKFNLSLDSFVPIKSYRKVNIVILFEGRQAGCITGSKG